MKITKYSNVSYAQCQKFYQTKEWKSLSAKFRLLPSAKFCINCGHEGKQLCVDHKEPIKYRWDLRLDENNLQILCRYCNFAKGNERQMPEVPRGGWTKHDIEDIKKYGARFKQNMRI